MYGGHAVASFGYGDVGLTETLTRASQTLMFQSNAVEVPIRTTAARALGEIVPGGPWRVLFVNSGAEANENALRLACRTTGRRVIAAVDGAFHGRTAAAAAVTAGSASWYGFPELPFEVRWLGDPDLVKEDVAAVIVEPVQGVAGARDLDLGFLAAVQESATAAGALVIADEIQSGMGRCGSVCAFSETPLRPDIVTLGKAIAGGFPAGAVLAKPVLADPLSIGSFGTTFGGGPMAAALVAEVACRLSSEGFLAEVRRTSDRLRGATIGRRVKRISGRGLLLGMHLDESARGFQGDLLEQGVIVGDAKDPHVARLLPPLILGNAEIDHFLDALARVGN